jgi:hypothetical protein
MMTRAEYRRRIHLMARRMCVSVFSDAATYNRIWTPADPVRRCKDSASVRHMLGMMRMAEHVGLFEQEG